MSLSVLQLVLLLILGVLFVALVIWCVGKVLDALDKPVESPEQKLVGQTGRVVAPVQSERGGKVIVYGEIWDAVLDSAELSVLERKALVLERDSLVRIVGFDPVDPRTIRVSAIE